MNFFKDPAYSMLIVLPSKRKGLSHLLKRVEKINLKQILQSERRKLVFLCMPKFKIETKLNLKETLQKV